MNKGRESLFTLTERMTREQIIIKIKSGRQSEIQLSINSLEGKYGVEFSNKFKTITFDNGVEFLDWRSIKSYNSPRSSPKAIFLTRIKKFAIITIEKGG